MRPRSMSCQCSACMSNVRNAWGRTAQQGNRSSCPMACRLNKIGQSIHMTERKQGNDHIVKCVRRPAMCLAPGASPPCAKDLSAQLLFPFARKACGSNCRETFPLARTACLPSYLSPWSVGALWAAGGLSPLHERNVRPTTFSPLCRRDHQRC